MSSPTAFRICVGETDLLVLGCAVVVDELPDQRGADQGDRQRQEDQCLGDGLDAGLVDEDGVDQADQGREDRRQDDPDRGVAQDDQLVGVREDRLVVVDADELAAGLVAERLEDRPDARVEQPERDERRSRYHEDDGLDELPASGADAVRQEEHDAHHRDEGEDGDEHLQELGTSRHGCLPPAGAGYGCAGRARSGQACRVPPPGGAAPDGRVVLGQLSISWPARTPRWRRGRPWCSCR